MRERSRWGAGARGVVAVLALYGLLLQGLIASFGPLESRATTPVALCSPEAAASGEPNRPSPHPERCCAALCSAGAAPPFPASVHGPTPPPAITARPAEARRPASFSRALPVSPFEARGPPSAETTIALA